MLRSNSVARWTTSRCRLASKKEQKKLILALLLKIYINFNGD